METGKDMDTVKEPMDIATMMERIREASQKMRNAKSIYEVRRAHDEMQDLIEQLPGGPTD